MNSAEPRCDIFVSLGTDHHPFPRLLDWVDRWLTRHPEYRERSVVQHGQTRASTLAVNHAFLGYDEMTRLMREATIIISHGGPATLFEARRAGTMPVCVPRRAALNEHVDDHQYRFARLVSGEDLVLLCEDERSFNQLLDRLVATPELCRVEPEDAARIEPTIRAVEAIAAELVGAGVPRRLPRLLRR